MWSKLKLARQSKVEDVSTSLFITKCFAQLSDSIAEFDLLSVAITDAGKSCNDFYESRECT